MVAVVGGQSPDLGYTEGNDLLGPGEEGGSGEWFAFPSVVAGSEDAAALQAAGDGGGGPAAGKDSLTWACSV